MVLPCDAQTLFLWSIESYNWKSLTGYDGQWSVGGLIQGMVWYLQYPGWETLFLFSFFFLL